ncbi:MAG TPA: hypothetical protein VKW06_09625 [Candidatus Angelobacter sp.]|nr:hypothetical protein [Candidatus Angelobacter sp.]
MKNYARIRTLMLTGLLLASVALTAQTTATGTINATLINKSGIALVFDSDPGGVALGNTGTAAASLNFGTVSAFGPLSAGVTRPTVLAGSYTVRTLFDVNVLQGGGGSPNYTLSANLAAAAPVGFSYAVDAVTLTTAAQNVQTNGAYGTDVQHSLNLTISTAAPGAGGPAVGAPLTTTINFTATAN